MNCFLKKKLAVFRWQYLPISIIPNRANQETMNPPNARAYLITCLKNSIGNRKCCIHKYDLKILVLISVCMCIIVHTTIPVGFQFSDKIPVHDCCYCYWQRYTCLTITGPSLLINNFWILPLLPQISHMLDSNNSRFENHLCFFCFNKKGTFYLIFAMYVSMRFMVSLQLQPKPRAIYIMKVVGWSLTPKPGLSYMIDVCNDFSSSFLFWFHSHSGSSRRKTKHNICSM